MTDTHEKTHCGFVSIIGAPNAGKSTLLNTLVGGKVAIVSPKVQTTRTRITGITSRGKTQIIFTDTPGIFQPQKRLDRAMVSAAWQGMNDSDLVVVMVDAAKKNPLAATRDIIAGLAAAKKKSVLVLNKIDLIAKAKLLELATAFLAAYDFDRIFMISAAANDGVDDLMRYLETQMPEGPWHYAEDDMTTMPLRLMAAEITREKIFLQTHEELPYACTVETDTFDESNPEKWVVEQTIYVQRESQRAIILGHKGQRLKEIGTEARKDMKKQFGNPIHVQLFVKVRENWQDDPQRYTPWGLDYKA
jgi:GTP-binding protein Era